MKLYKKPTGVRLKSSDEFAQEGNTNRNLGTFLRNAA
jgi:hypothetical protein